MLCRGAIMADGGVSQMRLIMPGFLLRCAVCPPHGSDLSRDRCLFSYKFGTYLVIGSSLAFSCPEFRMDPEDFLYGKATECNGQRHCLGRYERGRVS